MGRRNASARTPEAPAPSIAPAPAAPAAVEEARPPIKEIVSQAEKQRLKESTTARWHDITQILDQLKNRPLSPDQRSVRDAITSFLASSREADSNNDPRQADALAERAQILAKGLVGGK